MTRPDRIPINPFRFDLFSATAFKRLIKPDHQLAARHKRFNQQIQQDARTRQRTPNGTRKYSMKLLKMLLAAESYHAQIGAVAAERWNLSEPVCTMILHHHNPSESPQSFFMTHLINVADDLIHLKNQKLPLDDDFLMSASVASLGCTTDQLETVWEKSSRSAPRNNQGLFCGQTIIILR